MATAEEFLIIIFGGVYLLLGVPEPFDGYASFCVCMAGYYLVVPVLIRVSPVFGFVISRIWALFS